MTSSPASPPSPGARPGIPGPRSLDGAPGIPGPAGHRVSRVAELQLRSPAGPVPARVYWPTPWGDRRRPGLLVLFPAADHAAGGLDGTDDLGRALCAGAGLVVLSATYGEAPAEDATTAAQWSADHAAELGADPGRLLVGGEGFGAGLATAVAQHAHEQGWPPITCQVLISPEPTGGTGGGGTPVLVGDRADVADLVARLRHSLEAAADG